MNEASCGCLLCTRYTEGKLNSFVSAYCNKHKPIVLENYKPVSKHAFKNLRGTL